MAELGSGNGTEYPGTLDTYNTTVADSVDDIKADHMNDVNQAVIAIQGELGQDPAGSAATVVARLDAEHNADGTHAAVTATSAAVDNITIDGNTISSTDTAGNIILTPDTTGDLVLDGVNWPQADGAANTILKTDGSAQTSWVTPQSVLAGTWTNVATITLSSGSPTAVNLITGASSVSEIEGYFQVASTDTANQAFLFQIGDSGGFETSGYTGQGWANLTGHGVTANNTGWYVSDNSNQDAATVSTFNFSIHHMGSNLWTFWANGASADLAIGGNGAKTLTGALTQLRVTTDGGAAVFDGGTAVLKWR